MAEETDEAPGNEVLNRGIYHFRQESYEEALKVFTEVIKSDPASSLGTYYTGLTYKRMEDYVNARKYLERSLELTPKIKGALIELVDLLYRLQEYDAAKKWIAIAEEEGIRPAQAKFLKGLTLQKTGEYADAITAFQEAAELDDRLKQSAKYQIGVCHLKNKDFKEAKDIFREVMELDPNSELGTYADKYLDAMDRKVTKDQPFHFTARTAFEYDSNVILKPSETTSISSVTDESDTREVYDAQGDYTWKNEEGNLSLKPGYGIRVSKQNDLGKYDTIGNNVSLQGALSLDKMLLTVPVNYSHTIVDDKNYLSSISAGNIDSIMLDKTTMAQVGVIYANNDYLRPVQIDAENRDSNRVTALGGMYWFYKENQGFLNLRYTFDDDFARGENWDYIGNKIGSVILYPVFDKLKLTVNGDVYFQNYQNIHTIYDKKRFDQTYTAGAMLMYELLDNFELQVRYTFINERSNLSVYEYSRHIVGAGIQFKY
jgi:tetratricopeptide (TPR) repeat protein